MFFVYLFFLYDAKKNFFFLSKIFPLFLKILISFPFYFFSLFIVYSSSGFPDVLHP
ncbi:unnamed protein product [Meloidogyne enterolobii]|uniref:Uncharacterized protein n=1 Tax=Meloidogyne enterolobii TaxID=390850 RepID=A0ACB1AMD0_MELEN